VTVDTVELELDPRRSRDGWMTLDRLDELGELSSGYSKAPFSVAGVPMKSEAVAGHEPKVKPSLMT
jgi:hypothetical protein